MFERVPDQNERIINASASDIWAVLEDTSLLPRLVPGVTRAPPAREYLGAERSCTVTMAGRTGEVFEKCVAFDPPRRIAWEMTGDTMGMTRMYDRFGFGFTLTEVGPRRTKVVCEGDYRPGGLAARVLHPLMLKRKFRALREDILANLATLAEAPGVRSASAPRPSSTRARP